MYRNPNPFGDLSIDPEDILVAQRRARKKRLVALFVVVFVAGLLGATALFVVRKGSHDTRALAYDRLSTCLFAGPLPGGTTPQARMRETQLVVMTLSPEKRAAAADGGWPSRCGALAHVFAESARATGDEALATASEKLAKELSERDSLTRDLGAVTERTVTAAKSAGLEAHHAEGIEEPPPPATALTLATMPAEGRLLGLSVTQSSLHVMPFRDTTFHVVIDDKDLPTGPVLCTLATGSRELVCAKIPPPAAQASPGLRLWGVTAEGQAPFVFVGDRGKSGIYRSDTGARVDAEKTQYGAYGASVLADGSFAYLGWNDKPAEIHFLRVTQDGKKFETNLVRRTESGNPYYATAVFSDFVAYKYLTKKTDGIRLMVAPITKAGELDKPVDIGSIDEIGQIEGGSQEEPHFMACRTTDTTVLRAKGWRNTYLSFRSGVAAWSAPVESRGLHGVLQCRAKAATVTRIAGDRVGAHFKGSVHQSLCTASGCDERDIDVATMLSHADEIMPHEAKDIAAVDLEGKLLVVWSAGERGGLRARIGPIEHIGTGESTVLFDDHVRDGSVHDESALVDFSLHPVSGGVLVLFATVDGVHVRFVDAAGKWSPVRWRWR